MKIAVLGGCGFIGKSVVRRLVDDGHDTRVVDVRNETQTLPKGASLVQADITQYNEVERVLQDVDVVYDLAGTLLNTARRNPYAATQLDITGICNVLESCIKNRISKVIYSSSFYAYDGLPSERTVSELDHSDIFSAEMFGVVKLVAERILIEYSKTKGLNYVILRYGPAYGPDDRCSSVVYDFIKSGLLGKPLTVWGKGDRRNQYTYVEDIADATVRAIRHENSIFNIISPESLSLRQIAEAIGTRLGVKVTYDSTRPEGSSLPYIQSSNTMRDLGWRPVSVETGILRTIEAMQAVVQSVAE